MKFPEKSSFSDFLIPYSFSYQFAFRLIKPVIGVFLANLLSYGNENDNGYDKHLRSQTELGTNQ